MLLLIRHHPCQTVSEFLSDLPSRVDLVKRLRFVDAEWLLGEVIAGGGEGAGAASHADVAELAGAALPFQVVGFAELKEHLSCIPYIAEGLSP